MATEASAPSPPAANRAVCILRIPTVARRLFRSLKLKSSCEVRLTCSALHAALDPLLLARKVALLRKPAALPDLPAFGRLRSLSVKDGVPKANLQDLLRGLQDLGPTLEFLKLHLRCRLDPSIYTSVLPRAQVLRVSVGGGAEAAADAAAPPPLAQRLAEVELTLLGGAGLTSLLLSNGGPFRRDHLPKIAHSLKRLGGLRTLRFDVTAIKGGCESLFGTVWTAIEPPIRARLGSRLEHFALRESERDADGVPYPSDEYKKRCVLSHPGWLPDFGFGALRRTTLTEPKELDQLQGCRATLETLKLRTVMDRVPSLAPFVHLRRLYLQLTDKRFIVEQDIPLYRASGSNQQMHGISELVLHPELVNLRLESLAVELVSQPDQFSPRIALVLALPASLRHLSIRLGVALRLAHMLGLSHSLRDTHRGIPGTKESDFDPFDPSLRFRLKHDVPRLESLTVRQCPPSVVLDMLATVQEPLKLTRLSFEQGLMGERSGPVWLRAELAAGGASSVAEAFRAWWAAEEDRLCRDWSRDLLQKGAAKTNK